MAPEATRAMAPGSRAIPPKARNSCVFARSAISPPTSVKGCASTVRAAVPVSDRKTQPTATVSTAGSFEGFSGTAAVAPLASSTSVSLESRVAQLERQVRDLRADHSATVERLQMVRTISRTQGAWIRKPTGILLAFMQSPIL